MPIMTRYGLMRMIAASKGRGEAGADGRGAKDDVEPTVATGGDQGLSARLETNQVRLHSGQKGDLYPFPHPDSIPVDQLMIANVGGTSRYPLQWRN